jgi:hypothetical protein
LAQFEIHGAFPNPLLECLPTVTSKTQAYATLEILVS